MLPPRNDLHQLFQMIDMDRSGTIEVAEFIGPLSRWAHDSKTAPRFIKYNMLQTMHLQEDLYALSEDCFEHLAKRVDDLALQISALGKIGYGTFGTRQNETRTDTHESKFRVAAGLPGGPGPSNPSNPSPWPFPPVESDGILSSNLGLWTRHATEEVASTKSIQQEAGQVDQPPKSAVGEFLSPKAEQNHMNDLDQALLQSLLDSSMAKLESKVDLLLERSRMKGPEVGLGSEGVESWKGLGSRSRRKAPMLHPEAFRSMYINRRRRISLSSLDSSAQRPPAPHDLRRRTSEADAQFGSLPASMSSSLQGEQNQVHLAQRPSIELPRDL
eukprot:s541_g23.t1